MIRLLVIIALFVIGALATALLPADASAQTVNCTCNVSANFTVTAELTLPDTMTIEIEQAAIDDLTSEVRAIILAFVVMCITGFALWKKDGRLLLLASIGLMIFGGEVVSDISISLSAVTILLGAFILYRAIVKLVGR